eukprot:scaffold46166_cov18-Tisochrysis_lutea.AAC.1
MERKSPGPHFSDDSPRRRLNSAEPPPDAGGVSPLASSDDAIQGKTAHRSERVCGRQLKQGALLVVRVEEQKLSVACQLAKNGCLF